MLLRRSFTVTSLAQPLPRHDRAGYRGESPSRRGPRPRHRYSIISEPELFVFIRCRGFFDIAVLNAYDPARLTFLRNGADKSARSPTTELRGFPIFTYLLTSIAPTFDYPNSVIRDANKRSVRTMVREPGENFTRTKPTHPESFANFNSSIVPRQMFNFTIQIPNSSSMNSTDEELPIVRLSLKIVIRIKSFPVSGRRL